MICLELMMNGDLRSYIQSIDLKWVYPINFRVNIIVAGFFTLSFSYLFIFDSLITVRHDLFILYAIIISYIYIFVYLHVIYTHTGLEASVTCSCCFWGLPRKLQLAWTTSPRSRSSTETWQPETSSWTPPWYAKYACSLMHSVRLYIILGSERRGH